MLPTTTQRVSRNTSPRINERIRKDTERHVARFDRADPKEIRPRLLELNREWDTERALEANASVLMLAGIALGTMVDRRFYAIPAIDAGFLLQHAVSGWCPPMPILRRLGFRTQFEIEQERYALKALRGDFAGSTPFEGQPGRTQPILDAVRRP